jgi:glycosyltransferase involved in cell wall biosynthesis
MKLGLLAVIDEFTPIYSVANVVHAQLLGLQDLGFDMVFINNDGGTTPEWFKGETRFFPRLHLKDWFQEDVDDLWYGNAELIVKPMVEALRGVDVVLVNDLLMQGWYLPYLWALRRAEEELPNLKVHHLIHSGPTERRMLVPPRDELYRVTRQERVLYNNSSDLARVKAMYNTNRVIPVFNPVDVPKFLQLTEKAKQVYTKMRLWEGDVITMYPTRMSPGKQIEKWLSVCAGVKRSGGVIKAIIANAWSNGAGPKLEMTKLSIHAKNEGLVKGVDWCFTSEFVDDAELGLDADDISSLDRLCNVFIQTSISETCSLIQLEAMLNRQLLVLNEDLDCNGSGELSGTWCMMAKFSSLTKTTRYHPDFPSYCNDVGAAILNELANSKTHKGFLRALRYHNVINYATALADAMGLDAPVSVETPQPGPVLGASPKNQTTMPPSASGEVPPSHPEVQLPTKPGGGLLVLGGGS